jgi:transcriptional regulator with XRE-family HTH domain
MVADDELYLAMGQRLRELRNNYGFTQRQVADYLGIDQSNYSKIELGKRRIRTLHQLRMLCDLYDCSQEYLLMKSDVYVPRKWEGITTDMNLNVIAQANQTMGYLRTLRSIQNKSS